MSHRDDWIVTAHAKGYRVREDGVAVGVRGHPLRLRLHDGYYRFNVRVDGRAVPVQVHRLAAYQLFGTALFDEGVQVRHRDETRTNNQFSNLRLGTNLDNIMDRTPEARRVHACKAAAATRALTREQATALLQDRRAGATYAELCTKYDVVKSTVSDLVNGRLYKDVHETFRHTVP